MDKSMFIKDIQDIEEFFNRSTSCLNEVDSQYKPKEEIRTVAQTVAHAAISIDWFIEGAFGNDGFKMDFDEQEKRVREYTSLTEARKWFAQSIRNAIDTFSAASDEELNKPINDTLITGPKPRWTIIQSIAEHTAHCRGALTIYSRLLDKTPKMPYADM